MFDIKERPKLAEKAFLVSVYRLPGEQEGATSLLEELDSLGDTVGIPIGG